ncbi:helix-turn-helix transcriptional regulator [Pelagerythrobacter aerophilus]|uniref:LuxR family transcriptional regulator n=1 Tax=Pelagerythrobacter aerophilus TaxID=2306995 RepID=A0A418NKV6_9SPHN|nr:LuxR family transcriptional regulator [Pelagerythrobacter aerophilus]RIV80321.1 LuxR family transcriptional regulator [Pelagerythrobacter aerophilus]
MPGRGQPPSYLALAEAFVRESTETKSEGELTSLLEAIAREMGFRYYALIHHDDLRLARPDRIDLKDYPAAITDRLFGQCRFRGDPVFRGCLYADKAFAWSGLGSIIQLDAQDRASFEFGMREGLNEGITVPRIMIGECMASCTFAGTNCPEMVERYVGVAEIIGAFAFNAARRLLGQAYPKPAPRLHLQPRARDCVVLAGRGCSNKEIARELGITPRTVDGYMTLARELFEAHDRTELVISAILAGQVGLEEVKASRTE